MIEIINKLEDDVNDLRQRWEFVNNNVIEQQALLKDNDNYFIKYNHLLDEYNNMIQDIKAYRMTTEKYKTLMEEHRIEYEQKLKILSDRATKAVNDRDALQQHLETLKSQIIDIKQKHNDKIEDIKHEYKTNSSVIDKYKEQKMIIENQEIIINNLRDQITNLKIGTKEMNQDNIINQLKQQQEKLIYENNQLKIENSNLTLTISQLKDSLNKLAPK